VSRADLDIQWPDPRQRQRALDSLIRDGLVEPLDNGLFGLPA
jgi:A/G-specific adenine glycosylase